VIRCLQLGVISLRVQPEGGKSHTRSSNPVSESIFVHVLTDFLCGLDVCCWLLSLRGGPRRTRTDRDDSIRHDNTLKTQHNRHNIYFFFRSINRARSARPFRSISCSFFPLLLPPLILSSFVISDTPPTQFLSHRSAGVRSLWLLFTLLHPFLDFESI